MPLTLRRIALVVLTVLLASSSIGTAAADDSVFVDLFVNGVQRDPVLAVLRNGDVLLPAQALAAAHVPVDVHNAQTLHYASYESLAALHSELTYRFDPLRLRLDIALVSSALPKSTVDLSPKAPHNAANVPVSGLVVNYALHAERYSPLTGSLEQRYSSGSGVIDNTIGRSYDGRFARGLSNFTLDKATKMRRTVFGDAFAGTGDLGGSAILGGVSVQRAFDTNPYAVRFPLPSVAATVLQPSQADIVVNGAVVKTIDLQPGTYNLDNLPIAAGIDRAQVVLRDAFGAKTVFDSTLYGSAGLLRKGLTDYGYSAGLLRVNPEAPGDAYGPAAALASYRIGLSDYTTAGARFESIAGLWSGGLDYDALFRFADVHAALARSESNGKPGMAGTLAYSSASLLSSYSLVARFQSSGYANTSERVRDDRPLLEFDASAARRLAADTSLTLGVQVANYRDSGVFRQISAGITQRSGDVDLSLGFARSRWNTVTLIAGVPLGPTTMESTAIQTGPSPVTSTSIVHSPASPAQTAYALTVGANAAAPVSGAVQFGLPFATLAMQGYGNLRSARGFSGSADFSGAIVHADNVTLLSQPVRDAYALVEAPGASGAPVFLNNRYAARTNRAGYAVVPFLSSYQLNRLFVSDSGIAADEILSGEDQTVEPAYRGASIVRYRSHVEHGVAGRLMRKNGKPLQYGEIDLHLSDGRTLSSPIDETGRFYFEDLSPGSYAADAADSAGTCRVELHVPQFSGVLHALGTLACDR